MTWPAALNLVTVGGSVEGPAGAAAIGTVEFYPPYVLRDATDNVLLGTKPIIGTLSGGVLNMQVPANDSPNVQPQGWAYHVVVRTDELYYEFDAVVPSSPNSTTINRLVQVVNPTPPAVFVPLTDKGVANGVATLDGTGRIPTAQLPTGSGVLSVTAADGTIVVGGAPATPTVAVGTIAESQVTNLVADLAAKYVKPGTGIPSTDMTSAVQTALTAAGTAYQKPAPGIPKTDLVAAVQTSLSSADTAYQKPGGGIPSTDMSAAVQTSLALANTALQAAPSDRWLVPFSAHSAVIPFTSVNAVSTINNEAWFGKIIVRAGSPLANAIAIRSATTATHNTTGLNGFAIWNASASSLLWQSASDDLMWEGTGVVSKPITGIATPSVDTTFWIAVSARGYSAAAEFGFVNLGGKAIFGDFYARYKGGGYTSWPSSFNPATDLQTGGSFVLPIMIG